MTTLREAATQAFGALEGGADSWQLVGPAIDALKAALAEQVQEPVAWSYELATTMLEHRYDGWEHLITRYKPNVPEGSIRNLTPLFAAPPQRVPLTREEAIALWADKSDGPSNSEIVLFARAVERAHGII